MKYLLIVLVLFVGCDAFKGDKGDSGTDGSKIGIRILEGVPTENPQRVNCEEIYTASIVEVLLFDGLDYVKLPYTDTTIHHNYEINYTLNSVYLKTTYSDGTSADAALRLKDGTQYKYRITVKNFDTVNYLTQGLCIGR